MIKKNTTIHNGFKENAPPLMNNLIKDFGLTKIQAAGIVGNLSHESAGLQAGINQIAGGGLGWAQWSRSRRILFKSWAVQNNMKVTDPAANYGFLKHELNTTYKNTIDKIKQTKTIEESTRSWHDSFEKSADIKNGVIVKPSIYQRRIDYANKALALDLESNTSTQFI